ncbi:MAG: hypothetical protein MHM6MM_000678 [Cercozoa sp. M6MM]
MSAPEERPTILRVKRRRGEEAAPELTFEQPVSKRRHTKQLHESLAKLSVEPIKVEKKAPESPKLVEEKSVEKERVVLRLAASYDREHGSSSVTRRIEKMRLMHSQRRREMFENRRELRRRDKMQKQRESTLDWDAIPDVKPVPRPTSKTTKTRKSKSALNQKLPVSMGGSVAFRDADAFEDAVSTDSDVDEREDAKLVSKLYRVLDVVKDRQRVSLQDMKSDDMEDDEHVYDYYVLDAAATLSTNTRTDATVQAPGTRVLQLDKPTLDLQELSPLRYDHEFGEVSDVDSEDSNRADQDSYEYGGVDEEDFLGNDEDFGRFVDDDPLACLDEDEEHSRMQLPSSAREYFGYGHDYGQASHGRFQRFGRAGAHAYDPHDADEDDDDAAYLGDECEDDYALYYNR